VPDHGCQGHKRAHIGLESGGPKYWQEAFREIEEEGDECREKAQSPKRVGGSDIAAADLAQVYPLC